MNEKEYVIDEKAIKLKPITAEEGVEIVMDLSDEAARKKAIRDLMKVTLAKSNMKLSDFSIKALKELIEAVLDVNGLSGDEKEANK